MSQPSATLFLGGAVGICALKAVADSQFRIDTVILDRPHAHEDPGDWDRIKRLCVRLGISIISNSADALDAWQRTTSSQYLMSFGYRRMISRELRNAVSKGSLGTHFAPLPRYRGFAPLHWAIINGEPEWAISLFILQDEVDSGPIVASSPILIGPRDDINTLYSKSLKVLKDLLDEVLPHLDKAIATAIPQNEDLATYGCARNPSDSRVDWRDSSARIDRLVRAVAPPFPGAFCFLEGTKIVLVECEPVAGPIFEGHVPGRVGRISSKGVEVLCGLGEALLIRTILVDGVLKPAHDVIRSPRQTLT
ncbi:formyltransferase family protein [Ornithinimicrobium kibberense]|uniref:Methionyl-tRNA formyltransferase n=1 Tax=Ornithinimicrobium kibberense TaxID=282060 RepID=A0ABV5V6T1_9MICO